MDNSMQHVTTKFLVYVAKGHLLSSIGNVLGSFLGYMAFGILLGHISIAKWKWNISAIKESVALGGLSTIPHCDKYYTKYDV